MIHPLPKNILCPVDLSPDSEGVIRWAGCLAKAFNAQITLFHADFYEIPVMVKDSMVYPYAGLVSIQAEDLYNQLHAFGRRLFQDEVPWDAVISDGPAAEEIVHWAKENSIDFVVMSCHQRGILKRFLFGSVSEDVIQKISCPTLIVRNGTQDNPCIKKILCPVDCNDLTKSSFNIASELASSYGGDLYILKIEDDHTPETEQPYHLPDEWLEDIQEKICANLIRINRQGKNVDQIIQWSENSEIDLLVLGVLQRPYFALKRLGPAMIRLIRHSQCSVLIVPSQQYKQGIQFARLRTEEHPRIAGG
jgi:nucleotide-binding universal stress UspA family protein